MSETESNQLLNTIKINLYYFSNTFVSLSLQYEKCCIDIKIQFQPKQETTDSIVKYNNKQFTYGNFGQNMINMIINNT
jgi:hypothetical protein